MWLVDRETDGRGPRRISLPPPLKEALVRWYVGAGTHADEEAGITLVQQARIGAKWIACDCLDADGPPPILTPAFLSEAETYYLRRLTSPKRPEHRASCPFFREQATNRISEVRPLYPPAEPPSGYFAVLRPAPEKLAQRPVEDATDDRTRHVSVPRLARLLWRLIELAGVNRVPPLPSQVEEASIKSEFAAITRAAAKIEIAPGLELGRALWTHAQALHSNRAYAVLRELARTWPAGHAPQGFLALFSPGFRGHELEVVGAEPVRIANRVQSPSARDNPIRGPYLALVVAGQYPEAHGYAPLRAYAQPIYSGRRFIPIESDIEREALKEILALQRELAREGIDLALEKPLFDRLTQDGPYRPNFSVEAFSRRTGELRELGILIEEGRNEPATSPRQMARTLRISRADLDTGEFRESLRRALAS